MTRPSVLSVARYILFLNWNAMDEPYAGLYFLLRQISLPVVLLNAQVKVASTMTILPSTNGEPAKPHSGGLGSSALAIRSAVQCFSPLATL